MKPLEIGISMTGTVSAGAYTAGVIDFLLEALDQWEQEKTAHPASTPQYPVILKGLSGASGGGVSCGLIFNSIGKRILPVKEPLRGDAPENDFYNTWVNELGIEQLLDTPDLNDGVIRSLFNANAIPTIANKYLVDTNFGNKLERKYIDPNLVARITVTNLKGIPYALHTAGSNKPVIYTKHTDHVQLELSRKGDSKYPGSYVLSYDKTDARFKASYAQMKAACVATCAFPAAFKAQPVTQDVSIYKLRETIHPGKNGLAFPEGIDNTFFCSDGGILNTEPFELLHEVMLPKDAPPNEKNPPEAAKVERTIIMVAPLETFAPYNPSQMEDGLGETLVADVTAIRKDALFSDEEISKAFDESYYSRFIIAPVRYAHQNAEMPASPAITGTSLGTFGAFLSHDFREHDFFLGRRNAQRFLTTHFALPVKEAKENEIFKEAIDNRANYEKDWIFEENGVEYLRIIPLCGTAKETTYFPTWPKDMGLDYDEMWSMLNNRLSRASQVVLEGIDMWQISRWLVSHIAKRQISKLTNSIISKVKVDLIKNDLASYKVIE